MLYAAVVCWENTWQQLSAIDKLDKLLRRVTTDGNCVPSAGLAWSAGLAAIYFYWPAGRVREHQRRFRVCFDGLGRVRMSSRHLLWDGVEAARLDSRTRPHGNAVNVNPDNPVWRHL